VSKHHNKDCTKRRGLHKRTIVQKGEHKREKLGKDPRRKHRRVGLEKVHPD
jgi:hypothetical protein